jgi:septal ring factor EnvC (AmiA/AmiB activator)
MRRIFPGNSEPTDMEKSMEELQKLLEDKNTSTDRIKGQVIKVRRAREKNQQQIAKAKKELRELLTVRQEAILISMGLLD